MKLKILVCSLLLVVSWMRCATAGTDWFFQADSLLRPDSALLDAGAGAIYEGGEDDAWGAGLSVPLYALDGGKSVVEARYAMLEGRSQDSGRHVFSALVVKDLRAAKRLNLYMLAGLSYTAGDFDGWTVDKGAGLSYQVNGRLTAFADWRYRRGVGSDKHNFGTATVGLIRTF